MHSDESNKSSHMLQEDLQSLIATSTGSMDVYDITAYGNANMLLPQKMILAAMQCADRPAYLEWHNKMLPVFNQASPNKQGEVTALVIDSEKEATRFMILTDRMPKSLKLRISQMRDIDRPISEFVYQYVKVDEKIYQIPNIDQIKQKLFV